MMISLSSYPDKTQACLDVQRCQYALIDSAIAVMRRQTPSETTGTHIESGEPFIGSMFIPNTPVMNVIGTYTKASVVSFCMRSL